MVGICGRIGRTQAGIDPLPEWITWGDGEVQHRYEDGDVTVAGSFHGLLSSEQPVSAAGGDVLIWVWGDVYGHDREGTYHPRQGPPAGSGDYCRDLYEELGPEFVETLNGGFLIILYDREASTVSFVTDRLATRPVFYARPGEDTLVFASSAQALPHLPDLEGGFDEDYVREYLTLRRVFGVHTPLTGVEELQPGSVTTVDLADKSMSVDRYWAPAYRPVNRTFSSYVDRFTKTIESVLSEWTHDDLRYGLLLSGGRDSRLIQAAFDQPVTALHIADWMSREARIARRTAARRGDDFRLLKRRSDQEERALERSPQLSNFSGWFDQAYALGFEDQIDDLDVLVSGLYADMLFAGGPLATRKVSLGWIGNVSFPVAESIGSIRGYVTHKSRDANEPVPYLKAGPPIADILSRNIHRNGRGVTSHGVTYNTLRDLVMYGDFCPLGADTDAIFSRSLMHLRPYRTPFLDNRILDLQQQLPIRYQLRRDLVGRAMARLEPSLADLPHARTGVPMKHPFPFQYLGENISGFVRKHFSNVEERPPAPHFNHKPWPDRAALVRENQFIRTVLENREDLLTDLPFLDRDGAWECYDAHLNGADNAPLLYSLATFLEMPVTELIHRLARPEATIEG